MLKLLIEEWFQTLPNDDEAIRILADELRLPAARLLSVGQFTNDPVMSPRMVQKLPTVNGGEMMVLKSPHKFSKTPPEIPGPAAMLGEQSSDLLRSLCGYSDEHIKGLIEQGLIVESHSS